MQLSNLRRILQSFKHGDCVCVGDIILSIFIGGPPVGALKDEKLLISVWQEQVVIFSAIKYSISYVGKDIVYLGLWLQFRAGLSALISIAVGHAEINKCVTAYNP